MSDSLTTKKKEGTAKGHEGDAVPRRVRFALTGRLRALAKAINPAEARRVLRNVSVQGDRMIATDGMLLLRVPVESGELRGEFAGRALRMGDTLEIGEGGPTEVTTCDGDRITVNPWPHNHPSKYPDIPVKDLAAMDAQAAPCYVCARLLKRLGEAGIEAGANRVRISPQVEKNGIVDVVYFQFLSDKDSGRTDGSYGLLADGLVMAISARDEARGGTRVPVVVEPVKAAKSPSTNHTNGHESKGVAEGEVLSSREREVLLHALGFNRDGSAKTVRGLAYRNFYVPGGVDVAICNALAARGLMTEGRRNRLDEMSVSFYHTVTAAGAAAVGKALPE